jgi:hypothetical protein
MPTPNEKLCIICNTRKPDTQFETKGEHIVPRYLGSRKLRTPFVCKVCNGGLGGSVDIALKNVPRVALACFDREVVGGRSDPFENRVVVTGGADGAVPFDSLFDPPECITRPRDNPDIRGALLKIAYEATHLRLGNNWLHDPIAAAIREALFAYVCKDREKARRLTEGIPVRDIPIDLFYYIIGKSRSDHVKKAAANKSALNGLWIVPFKTEAAPAGSLAVVFDIEGLPAGCVTVSESDWGIKAPELLAPKLK